MILCAKGAAEQPAPADEEEPVKKKRGGKSEPVIPIIPSDRVQELVDSLEFNEVDMYRLVKYICTGSNRPNPIIQFQQ